MSAEWRDESCNSFTLSSLEIPTRWSLVDSVDGCACEVMGTLIRIGVLCKDWQSFWGQIGCRVGLCHPVMVSYHPYTRATSSDHRPQCAFNAKLLGSMHSQHSYVVTERETHSAPSHSSF
jgi:hypothetical protein